MSSKRGRGDATGGLSPKARCFGNNAFSAPPAAARAAAGRDRAGGGSCGPSAPLHDSYVSGRPPILPTANVAGARTCARRRSAGGLAAAGINREVGTRRGLATTAVHGAARGTRALEWASRPRRSGGRSGRSDGRKRWKNEARIREVHAAPRAESMSMIRMSGSSSREPVRGVDNRGTGDQDSHGW